MGQEFAYAKEFKKALSNHRICHARDIYFMKNMYSRVGARCKAVRCLWNIWASRLEKDQNFQLKPSQANILVAGQIMSIRWTLIGLLITIFQNLECHLFGELWR